MYTEFFGLRESPFSIAPDPQYLFLSQRDREALAHFRYGISVSGGFVQLTGEVGTGKTMLIRALLEELPEDVDVALVLNPVMTVFEFVAAICDELRVSYRKTTKSLKVLVDALNAYLLENHANGRRTVLIMDEAQNLSPEVLEQVRLLTNLETSKHKLLQIILVGQPELNEKLAGRNMRQLAQRITARYNLVALKRNETSEYIAHRCRVAGADRELFGLPAISWVHRLSGGNPRMINIICDRALMGAYGRSQIMVDAATVRRAAAEVGDSVPGRYWLRHAKMLAAAMAAGVIVLTGWQLVLLVGTSTPQETAGMVSRSHEAVGQAEPLAATPVRMAVPSVESPGDHESSLERLLSDPTVVTDTESAFRALFARWNIHDISLTDRTGCEIAEQVGLRCIFSTGTWNNLRNFNRPAVIELLDVQGDRHHVVVDRMIGDEVLLNFGGQTHGFAISEVDRYWYGKYLLVWRPPSLARDTLRRGARGETVLWLRDVLARYEGNKVPSQASDLFDEELEIQLKEFQRQHQLVADGIVGQFTLMQLNNYNQDHTAPVLWRLPEAETG